MGRRERLANLREQVAQDVLERIRTDAATALWPYRGLLLELAKDLFNPDLRIGRVWQRLRQKDHSLSSRFAYWFVVTPREYLEERRIEVAAKLLAHRELKASIEEVGASIGYSNVRVFQRAFRRIFGITAGDYRRQHGAQAALATEVELTALSEKQLNAQLAEKVAEKVAQLAPGRLRESWLGLLDGGFELTTPALFEQLLGLSRELGRRDRQVGIKLAEKAVANLSQLRGKLPETELAALEARGWAWVGNAQRLAYDFSAAEAAFERATAIFPAGHSPLVEVEILDLLGYLRLDQRRLGEALELTERALSLYRVASKTKLLVEILLDRAEILRLQGNAAAAIPSLEEASRLVDREDEPFLALATFQILALTQVQLGNGDEALKLLPVVKDLSQQVEHPQAAMQIVWLEGLIHAVRGEAGQACELLSEARRGFLALCDTGNAAIIALDLAEQNLKLGQTAAAGALANEAMAVFEGLPVAQEAMTAVCLLRQALDLDRLNAVALRQARESLERSRRWDHPIGSK